jgi:hypothetical protein
LTDESVFFSRGVNKAAILIIHRLNSCAR